MLFLLADFDLIMFYNYFLFLKMSVYSSQIIKTLSEQVQHLQPLRQSHHHLQAYHAKLIQDMQEAIAFGV